jgi:hypothetical protein
MRPHPPRHDKADPWVEPPVTVAAIPPVASDEHQPLPGQGIGSDGVLHLAWSGSARPPSPDALRPHLRAEQVSGKFHEPYRLEIPQRTASLIKAVYADLSRPYRWKSSVGTLATGCSVVQMMSSWTQSLPVFASRAP